VFSILSAWIAYDLVQVESGNGAGSSWGWPVDLAYYYLGFWPALLAAPMAGALIVAVWVVKLRRMDERP
jgi:hypothetical protein